MSYQSHRTTAAIILSLVAAIAALGAAVLYRRASAAPGGSHSAARTVASNKTMPPNMPRCPTGPVANIASTGGTAAPLIGSSLDSVLSSAASSSLGSNLHLKLLSPETPASPDVLVTLGGQYQGHGSCDFSLSDHALAKQLGERGAAALATKGIPVAKSGSRGEGEQRYLLSSKAFLGSLAYILYIVPDPASAQPNSFGGKTYTHNLYAVAAVASDGTVRYADSLAQ